MSEAGQVSYVERASADDFVQTLARVEAAIAAAGMTLFARIDHAGAAHDVGLTMPPTMVLVYGNPRGGTPLMQAAPPAALDLPLRVLVRQDESGKVLIGFHPILAVLRAAGVPDALASKLGAAQAKLMQEVAG